MDIVWLPFLLFFGFFLFLPLFWRVPCPDCGRTLPVFYSPTQKTPRMWREGGYLCPHCGCEANLAGEKVIPDIPPEPFPVLLVSLQVVALLGVIGLLVAFHVILRSA